jgi:MFS family permease
MLKLIKKYPQIIIFGALSTMFSGPGQSYLASLFFPHMRGAFGMDRSVINGIYSAATLMSAVLLPVLGWMVDKMRVVRFALIAGVLLALGCLVLNQSQSLIAIGVGFFLIRNLGQGGLVLVSATTMARTFGHVRGKALSLAHLGYPIGEAIFPIIVTYCIFAYGWRAGWMLLAVLVAVIYVPSVFFLMRKDPHMKAHADIHTDESWIKGGMELCHEGPDWSVKQVFKDWRFYCLIVPTVIPPGVLTALFLSHGDLFPWKGWSLQLLAAAFVAYAIGRACASLIAGPLIDRFSAGRIMPLTLIPMCAGLICFLLGSRSIWAFGYLIGMGVTVGFSMIISGALWAELYGTKKLGSIRGYISQFVVLSTAVAPVAIGYLLDHGTDPAFILKASIILTCFGVALSYIACKAKIK